MPLQTTEIRQLLAERVEPILTNRDAPFWHDVKRVVDARGRYLRKGSGIRNAAAWDHAIRALSGLRDPETRAAVEAAERLGGSRAVASIIAELGRKPREKLSPEEKARRQRAGVSKRSTKLGRQAEARLAAARMTLAKAQRAVARAEDLVKKWGERVRYHRKNGNLPPEEEG
jgi:hypothetical protein